MTAENKKKYESKLKRLLDALDLKEPDMVPIDIDGGKFMINYAGRRLYLQNFCRHRCRRG